MLIQMFGRDWMRTKYQIHRAKLLHQHALTILHQSQTKIDEDRRQRKEYQEYQQDREEYNVLVTNLGYALVESFMKQHRHWIGTNFTTEEFIPHFRTVPIPDTYQLYIPRLLALCNKYPTGLHYTPRSDNTPQYVRKCPLGECRGFLTEDWVCSGCYRYVCRRCHDEIKPSNDNHHCDPLRVATIDIISRESKSCPSCGMLISKNGGCDQMFCISCHTGFDWKTQRIIEGPVDNEYYYNWVVEGGRHTNEVCDHITVPFAWRERLQELTSEKEYEVVIKWMKVMDSPGAGNIGARIRHPPEIDFITLGERYLLGEYDEKTWKQRLQQAEKEVEKQRCFRELDFTFLQVTHDLVQVMMTNMLFISDLLTQLNDFTYYCIDEANILRKKYESREKLLFETVLNLYFPPP